MTNKNPHIEAYILAKYAKQVFPLLTEESIRNALESYFGFLPSEYDMEKFLVNFRPNGAKISIFKGLRNIGLSQTRIAEITGYSQSMVSRYVNMDAAVYFEPSQYYAYVKNEYVMNNDWKFSQYVDTYCKVAKK